MPVFEPCDPTPWTGHYGSIPGNTTTYHVNARNQIQVLWYREDEELRLPAKAHITITSMGRRINAAKQAATGGAGGKFLINEFGDVIVPTAKRPHFPRFRVGRFNGVLEFQDPDEEDRFFSLEAEDGLEPGDAWNKPYVGSAFHLRTDGRIYRLRREDDWQTREVCPRQDRNLIRSLRKIRPENGCRFIVNHYGVVLTKVHKGGRKWQPVFVGRINAAHWFENGGCENQQKGVIA